MFEGMIFEQKVVESLLDSWAFIDDLLNKVQWCSGIIERKSSLKVCICCAIISYYIVWTFNVADDEVDQSLWFEERNAHFLPKHKKSCLEVASFPNVKILEKSFVKNISGISLKQKATMKKFKSRTFTTP